MLGLAFGLAVLVGNSIGMGILRTPGEVAAALPSAPLFLAVWVAGALYALLGALTVAELAAMRPRSGGLFPLVHHGLGDYPGFVSGWTDWVATCGSVAAVALVLGEYAGPLVPMLSGHVGSTASAFVVAFALLQLRGIRAGDVAQQVTSLLKTLLLAGLAVVALASRPESTEAAVDALQVPLPTGFAFLSVVVVGLQSVVFTYDGWTGPVYFGEEVQDPGRDIPRSMIGGVLLVLAIYLSLNVAFLAVVPIHEMAGDPFVAATVAQRLFGPAGNTVVRLVTVVSLCATINALVLMASRVPWAMSGESLMPRTLRGVNAGGTPAPALVASTLVSLLFIASHELDRILALLSFFFVANYVLTFTSLFRLRRTRPDAPRPFRVPGYPWVPGLALAGSVAFVLGALWSDRVNSLIAVGLIAASWPLHRAVRRRVGA